MAAADQLNLTALDWRNWSKDDVVALADGLFVALARANGVPEIVEAQRWCLAPRPPLNRRRPVEDS